MARKRQSPIENLIDIATYLPWKAGTVLALVAYLGFHYAASLPLFPVATANLKSYSQSIGHSVGRQLIINFSSFLQYGMVWPKEIVRSLGHPDKVVG